MSEALKPRPMPEIMAELQAAVDEVCEERLRFGYVADTIRVNAMRLGATSKEIEDFVRGRSPFVSWLSDKVETKRLSDALGLPEVAALIRTQTALCDAYAACNGEDHPAYVAARAALRKIEGGDT